MNELEIAGVALVLALVVAAAIASFCLSPCGPLSAKWRKHLHELEVSTRMNQGAQLVQDLRDMARLYRRLGKKWEAEQALRRAITIAQHDWGNESLQLANLLEEQATLMASMHRSIEATTLRKQAAAIRKNLQ